MARRSWIFLVYIIIALYIANVGFGIIKFPDVFATYINKWILLVAAVFLFIESFKYLRPSYGYGTY